MNYSDTLVPIELYNLKDLPMEKFIEFDIDNLYYKWKLGQFNKRKMLKFIAERLSELENNPDFNTFK